MSNSKQKLSGQTKAQLSSSVNRASLGLLALEPRVLLDAAGVVTGAEGAIDALGQLQADDVAANLFKPAALEAPRDSDFAGASDFLTARLTENMALLQSLQTQSANALAGADISALSGNLETGTLVPETMVYETYETKQDIGQLGGTQNPVVSEDSVASPSLLVNNPVPSQVPIVPSDYWQIQDVLPVPANSFEVLTPIVSEDTIANISVSKPLVSEDTTIANPVIFEDIIAGKPIVFRDYFADNATASKDIVSRDYGAETVAGSSLDSAFGEIKPIVYRDYRPDNLVLTSPPNYEDFVVDGSNDEGALGDNLLPDVTDTLSVPGAIVVFVDTSVEGYQAILDTLDPSVEVVLIGARQDGIEAMAEYLSGRTDIDAVHIISHGREGTLSLGTSRVNAASINGQYADELAIIGDALTASGDILIYGCDFGRNSEALDALALVTGADIAASTNDTGAAELGGDWILESKVGFVEAENITAPDFTALLAPVSISAPNGSLSIVDNLGNSVGVGGSITTAGGVATWSNAGTVGGAAVDIRAVVVSIGPGDRIVFEDPSSTGLDDPSFIVFSEGTGSPAQVLIRWEIVLAGTNIAATGNIDFTIADIDGIGGNINTRETVAPSLDGLTSYGRETPSNIQFTTAGGTIRGSGTQDQNGQASSAATFSWTNVSSWEVTYELAGNGITSGARFTHDGDGDFNFNNLEEFFLLSIDADGDNSTTGGANYLGEFTENAGAIAIVDSDIDIVQDAALGTDVHEAQITLTNPQIGDEYFINGAAVSAGDTGTVGGFDYTVTDTGTELVVLLTGTGTDVQYEAALQLITFNNTSENPDTTNRVFDVSVTNTTFGTTSNVAISTIVITALNDVPVAQNDDETTDEDTVLSDSVLTNNGNGIDSDIDGDTLNVTQVNGSNITSGAVITLPSGALLTMNADGTYDYDPNGSFETLAVGDTDTDSFAYEVSDGNGGTATATVTITINGVNDAPIAQPDGEITDEDTAFSDSVLTDNGNGVDADPDTTDTLTVTEVNGTAIVSGGTITLPSGALLTMNDDGTYSYNPNGQFESLAVTETTTDSFSYTVDDGNGGTDTETVTITITGINDAPTAQDDAETVGEDSVLTGENVLADNGNGADSDPDISDVLNVTEVNGTAIVSGGVITLPSGALLTMSDDGSYDYDPNGVFNGLALGATAADSFTYTIDDGNGSTDTATVTITITGVNDAPIAQDDAVTGDEDIVATGSVFADNGADVDADPDGDIFVVSTVGGSALDVGTPVAVTGGGLITINPDGTYSFDSNGDFEGLDVGETATASITYTIDDGNGGTDTATITVTVTGVNDAPIVTGTLAGQAGTDNVAQVPFDASTVFSDPDIETLTFGSPDLPAWMSIDPVTGIITGTPPADASQGGPNSDGVYTVTVTATDPDGEIVSTTVTYTFANPAPVVDTAIGPQAAVDNETVSIPSAISDPDGDALTYAAIGLPTGLSIDPATGEITGTIDNSASQGGPLGDGVYTVTVTADDGEGGTITDTFDLTVPNPPPAAQDDALNGDEDTVSTGDLFTDNGNGVDADPDGDVFVVSEVNGVPANVGVPTAGDNGGEFTINPDGTYSFDPNGEFDDLAVGETRDTTITYTIDDGEGGTSTATVTLTVAGVNDAPEPIDLITGLPPVDPADYIPAQTGDDSDPMADLDLTPYFTDTDGSDVLTISVDPADLPLGLSFDPLTGVISGTPDADASQGGVGGVYTIPVTVDDGNGGTFTTNVVYTISNPAPIAQDDAVTGDEDTVITGDLFADNGNGVDSDPDGDTFVVSEVNGLPANVGTPTAGDNGGLITINPDGTYSFDPNGDFEGLDVGETAVTSITYTIDDGEGGTSTATVTVTVTGVNDAPIVTGTLAGQTGDDSVAQTPFDASTVFSDPDIETLTFGSPNLPSWMSIDPLTGIITGTPPADASQGGPNSDGVYTVTVTATDPDGEIVSTSMTYTFINPPPVVDVPVGPQAAVDNETISIPVDVSDPDGDTLTYSVSGLPTGLSIDPVTGEITGIIDNSASQGGPNGDGVYTVTVTADDGEGGTVTDTFELTVTNPAPIAEDDAVTGDEDTVSTGDLFTDNGNGVDADPDGDIFIVSEVNGVPANVGTPAAGDNGGEFTINPDGTYSFDPNGDFDDLAVGETRDTTITYTIDDGEGGTSTATVILTVAGVNDAPEPVDPLTGLSPTDPTDYIPEQTGDDSDPMIDLDLTPYFTDPDSSDALTISVDPADLPSGLTFDPATSIISGTPDLDASQGGPNGDGVYTIPVTVDDGNGGTFTTDVVYTISNPAPIAVDDGPIDITEDEALVLDVLGNDNDPDGDPLTITEIDGHPIVVGGSVTLPSGSTVTLNPDGTLEYGPAPNLNGPDTFTYTITDADGASDTASVDVNILPVNDTPETDASLPDQLSEDGETITPIDVSGDFSDIDGDPLTFTVTGLPPGLSIDPDTGIVSGTLEPGASADGPYTVVVTATDPDGDSISTDFVWEVENVPPIVTQPIGPQSGVDGQPVTIPTADSFDDPDGDILTFTATGLPEGLSIDPASGVITGALPSDSSVDGPYTVTVTVTDEQGDSVSETFELAVTNPAPIVNVLPPATINVGEPYTVDIGAVTSDSDGDVLTFTATGLPEGLTIDPATGVITGAPTVPADGPYIVEITVSDGQGGTSVQTLELTVNEDPYVAGDKPVVILPLGKDVMGRSKSVGVYVADDYAASSSLARAGNEGGLGRQDGKVFDLRRALETRDTDQALSDILDEYNYRLRGGMAMSATLPGFADGAHVLVEGVAHDNSIFVTMTETISALSDTNVTGWSVDMRGGALPPWIDFAQGRDFIVLNRTIADETATLRITAVLDNGRRVSGTFEIDMRTGEVELVGSMSASSLTLSEQFTQLADTEAAKDKALMDALA